MRRILVISDSLGTPVHGRGILNYTAGLIATLKQFNVGTSLLVETPGLGRIDRRRPGFEELTDAALRIMEQSAVYAYLSGPAVENRLRGKGAHRRLALKAKSLLRKGAGSLGLKLFEGRVLSAREVENRIDAIDYVPTGLGHLASVDVFALAGKFYTGSILRASYDLAPATIDAQDYDAVVLDTAHFVTLKRGLDTPVILVIHDLIPLTDPLMREWRIIFAKKLMASLRVATHLVFVSESTRREFGAMFPDQLSRLPSEIIPPIIRSNLMQAAETATARKPRGEKPVFVSIVSDEPRKNISCLVEAFQALQDEAELVIVGKINTETYIPDRLLLGSNISFTGYVSDQGKMGLLRRATACIFPSHSEGFGIPIVEGAVFGLPVICSDIPVFREITDGHASFFDPNDANQLAQKVREVAADPEKFVAQAERLRQHCLNSFGADAVAEKVARLFELTPQSSDLGGPSS